MNTFFATAMERWRIGRFIPCERNAPDSHHPCYSEHTGLIRSGEQWLQSFSARRESPGGKEPSPERQRVVKEILTPHGRDTLMNTFLSTTIEFWPVEKVIPY